MLPDHVVAMVEESGCRTENTGMARLTKDHVTHLPAVLFGRDDPFLKMFLPDVHLASLGSFF